VKERIKEKQILNEQLEKLDTQIQNQTIDQITHERLRDVLEINYLKQREEALEKVFLKNKKSTKQQTLFLHMKTASF
jgi:benzoyl-CoA reductase/2-hydroxyglutaryl-CoA dehydratase subunit BcrC/BadD/HgdB